MCTINNKHFEVAVSNNFGFQIKPIPDETFFGLVVAAGILAGYETYGQAYTGILGQWKTCPSSLLPGGLQKLSSFLPPRYSETPETLCNEHTALPYFQHFARRETVARVKDAMLSDQSLNIHRALGLTHATVRVSQRLKYCSACAKEQFSLYTRSTWLRSHQLPGVKVCYKHGLTLSESEIFNARYGIHSGKIQLPSPSEISHTNKLWLEGDAWGNSHPNRIIAQISHELLLQHQLLDNAHIRGRAYRLAYLAISNERGTVIDWRRLENTLRAKYGDIIPRGLGIDFACRSSNAHWVRRITEPTRGIKNPLQHVLIIGAMFDSFNQLDDALSWASGQSTHYNQLTSCNGKKKPSPSSECSSIPHPKLTEIEQQIRDSNRRALTDVLSRNPHFSRNEIKNQLGKLQYKTTLRNDREWMESILPPKQNKVLRANDKVSASKDKNSTTSRSGDHLKLLDQKLAAEIINLPPADILRIHQGKVESNNAQIARLTGMTYSCVRKLASFPCTKNTLSQIRKSGLDCLSRAGEHLVLGGL
jgi:hypothetical protein